MNKLTLKYLPPNSRFLSKPVIDIEIDGENLFEKLEHRVAGAQLSDIFKNRYNNKTCYECLNGEYYFGYSIMKYNDPDEAPYEYDVGLGGLTVCAVTENNITKWEVSAKKGRLFDYDKKGHDVFEYEFDTDEYKKEIEKIKDYYLSYEWEAPRQKIYRLCNEFIKKYKTKDNEYIDGRVTTNITSQTYYPEKWPDKTERLMLVDFLSGYLPCSNGGSIRNQKQFLVNWDGKTLESAMESLKEFAEKELVLKTG